LALGKDGIIRKVVDENMDTGNRFSVLKKNVWLQVLPPVNEKTGL
jgi:hypothetical protein